LKAVIAEMETAHGKIPGGRVALAGMGKLGSFELTAGSDVDLILLYEHDDDASESDGAKPLDPVRYYTRLTQRLIAALSAPTAEGVLYEVDMRLRPSGNKGPVATRLRAFARYQREEAWTWEHMALSRARMMSGDAGLVAEAERIIEEVLAAPRDRAKTVKDVLEMRALIEQEKPAKDIWDLKLIPGGLVDIEFIAQYLALVAPAKGHRVRTNELSTADALKALGALIDPNDLDTCLSALKLYTDLSQVIRLCIDGPFDPAKVPAGLTDRVARAAESPDMKTAEAEVKRLSKAVRKVFARVVS
jgi:glutamate-ammonia-ligase adenylyltransferase